MDGPAVYLAVAAAITLGAMSPGPSFVVVARTALSGSRSRGVLAALGMGIGGSLFALAAVLGLQVLLSAVPALYTTLQIAGALYLLYIALMLWKFAPQPLSVTDTTAQRSTTALQDFLLGLGTQLSNPKTAIVYASVFAAALQKDAPWTTSAALVPTVFAIEFGWYALVAVAFSTGRARQAYFRGKTWIDRLAATAMGMLGVKILSDIKLT
jgi:threonine/homoserine/homoserine lactone efflux protein